MRRTHDHAVFVLEIYCDTRQEPDDAAFRRGTNRELAASRIAVEVAGDGAEQSS